MRAPGARLPRLARAGSKARNARGHHLHFEPGTTPRVVLPSCAQQQKNNYPKPSTQDSEWRPKPGLGLRGPKLHFSFNMLDFSFKMLDFSFKILDFSFKIVDFGFRMLDFSFKMLDFSSKMLDFSFRKLKFSFKMHDFSFRMLHSSLFYDRFGTQKGPRVWIWRRALENEHFLVLQSISVFAPGNLRFLCLLGNPQKAHRSSNLALSRSQAVKTAFQSFRKARLSFTRPRTAFGSTRPTGKKLLWKVLLPPCRILSLRN